MDMKSAAKKAKEASWILAESSSAEKNSALMRISAALELRINEIISANEIDLDRSAKEGISKPILKRLAFGEQKIREIIEGIQSLVSLADPVGKTLMATELDKGLDLYRVSCPIGVIGIIFESRPDALVQISTLCLKSGNTVLLKGGSEARETNKILAEIIEEAVKGHSIPDGWIHLVETRDEVKTMLELESHIDLIIPRGSNEFVRYIMDHSHIPVMGHADGICHVFVDQTADVEMAVSIAVDSKTQYVAVCNAAESLLVHEKISKEFLPKLKEAMDKKNVTLRGCDRTRNIINAEIATDADWKTEYLDYILSIKIVDSLDEAIEHINTYGSHHTDAIVSGDESSAQRFMNRVDSGGVYWNCSTRFADGFKYGLGAEVGVSTSKIHARGPVGLEGLVTYKYKLIGNGNIAADYAEKRKTFTHIRKV